MRRLLTRSRYSGPLMTFILAAVAFGVAIGSAAPAAAQGNDWCAADPILMVNGKTVNVIVGVMGSADDVRANVQHAHFTIFLPAGVEAEIVGYEGDYFTESAEIVFDDSLTYTPGQTFEMRVEVTFQATKSFPAVVYVTVDGESRQIASGVSTTVLSGVYQMQ